MFAKNFSFRKYNIKYPMLWPFFLIFIVSNRICNAVKYFVHKFIGLSYKDLNNFYFEVKSYLSIT